MVSRAYRADLVALGAPGDPQPAGRSGEIATCAPPDPGTLTDFLSPTFQRTTDRRKGYPVQ